MFTESIQNPKCKNTNFLFYRRGSYQTISWPGPVSSWTLLWKAWKLVPAKRANMHISRNVKVFLWLLACVWGSVLLGAYLTETTELWQTVQCTNKSLQDCQNRSARISFWKYLHEFLLQLHVHQLLQIATLGIVWSMVNFNCTVFITDKGLR